MVAKKAATGLEFEQSLTRTTILGVEPQQGERASGLRLRAHPEHERRPKQVLERFALSDKRIGDKLGADDRHRQLRAPHALKRGEQCAPDRVAEQTPSLVECQCYIAYP